MPDTIIRTQHLRYAYGRQPAVRDLDLDIPAGAIYGFLGPNGAGKSTTIKLLLGLLTPTGGEVLLFGRPLRAGRRQLLRRIGALIEAPSLYGNLTARENLRWLDHLFGRGSRRIDEVLDLVDLQPAADKQVRRFSMGMKQRLGIAMALFHDPDLLVLDEPVNGLDPAGIQEMRALFLRLRAAGKTLLVSSHILAEVEKIATHVGIIQGGALRFQGPVEALQAAHRTRTLLRTPDAAAAVRLLGAAGIGAAIRPDGLLDAAAGEGPDLHRLLATLVGGGIEIHHVEPAGASLEELFFELTGAQPAADGHRAGLIR